MTMFAVLPERDWPATGYTLTQSLAGSRVRICLPLESGPALKANGAAYGSRWRVLLASFDPASSSWKTSQNCLLTGSVTFSVRWPRSGMMRSGIVFRQAPLVRPISEIECGLLPTPRKSPGFTNPTLGKQRNDCLTTRLIGKPILGARPTPQFVEWMMGLPSGWTELRNAETP